jgi:hypothetical protein
VTEAVTPLASFLEERLAQGPLASDELLRLLVPLIEQVIDAHRQERVAPLEGLEALSVTDGRAFFSAAALRAPRDNFGQVERLDREESAALEILSLTTVDRVSPPGDPGAVPLVSEAPPLSHPKHLGGYRAWEHAVGHHDPLTDVYSLGLLLASFGCALDLRDEDDLERFTGQGNNPFAFNPRLHPVIGKLIVRMTELSRRKRAQDLPGLLATLRTYREQRLDLALDLRQTRGFQVTERASPRQLIQARLRERLFEISRRNRLLHWKATLSTLNLTVASVPLLLDYKSIAPESLFCWQGAIAGDLSAEKAISLGRYLRFEDAPYIGPVLDKIRAEDRRNRAEFGFSQLRMALAFLRWHDLKADKDERISSPLVLLPVTLEKKKGVRDAHVVTPTTDLAEINPVLRYLLRERYGLELPEAVDLGQTTLAALFESLREQIAASEPGVTLRLIERPQIRLVHERARARLEQFRRSARAAGRRMRSYGPLDYSYDRDSFRPLGLQLFLQRVRPTPLPWRGPGAEPRPRDVLAMGMVEPEIVEQHKYVLAAEENAGPYAWDFDLCSVTLGNFQYRKMSLVRDYNLLLDRPEVAHPAFDGIFALTPRPADGPVPDEPSLSTLTAVVPADPTQARAILRGRKPESYIIQGPPGTGKSQTITNLIADFVARGQRVLFVCEKRAAIDVVFHRLKQCGLDHLCALIHDSQADKREFIAGLKSVTDRYLQEPDGFDAADRARTDLTTQVESDLGALEHFSAAMQAQDRHHGVSLRELIERLIALEAHRVVVPDSEAEGLPGYAEWRERQVTVRELVRTVREVTGASSLAAHPWRWLPRQAVLAERPVERLTRSLGAAQAALGRALAIAGAGGLLEPELTVGKLRAVLEYLELIGPLVSAGLARLVQADDATVAALRASVVALDGAATAASEARTRAAHWREPLPAEEVELALAEARRVEGAMGFFRPTWWRLRKVLAQRYDFGKHAVKPGWITVLEWLRAAYQAEAALATARATAAATWGTSELAPVLALVERLRAEASRFAEARSRLAAATPTRLEALRTLAPEWAASEPALAPVMTWSDGDPVAALAPRLEALEKTLGDLPEALPHLARLAGEASEALWSALLRQPWTPDQLEYAVVWSAIQAAMRRDRAVMRMNGHTLSEHVARIEAGVAELRALNARWVAARAHEAFRRKAARSELPAAQLAPEEKEWKKRYARGRRELEHEFAKVMRHRSIRELSTGDPGLVVADLKPVWLMSPLSVSDALPLEDTPFDVVIFDEASQIPTEEAVPALYRAPKTIVVGDRQQLPPTDFFSSRTEPGEDDEAAGEESEGGFELDSDSFLTQSTANLPSTMLSWHYRSRSESLISFSNASFYQGRLLTIPDCAAPRAHPPIQVQVPDQGDAHAERVLDRPISFHHLPSSPYEERRNPGEAAYIARLLRGLLRQERRLSIGVVAFSMAQQGEIERALEGLAAADPDFAQRLEAEYTREEDDQYCGLFVKNLENVQGDERDIIIVSICYGPGPDGKMLMNFGPINKSGGERRLNVVFSRARRHMVVVSSILHTAITNQYNDGASCLRRYLEFSAAASIGDLQASGRVLEACCPDLARLRQRAESRQASVAALAGALQARGFEVALGVGASHFRCDLAVRRRGEQSFRLGVLLDDDPSYRSAHALERWVDRPALLRQAGWQVALVLGKDIQENLKAVVAGLERTLAN